MALTKPIPNYPHVMYVNRVSTFLNAMAHILGSIIATRSECFSEQVLLLKTKTL